MFLYLSLEEYNESSKTKNLKNKLLQFVYASL